MCVCVWLIVIVILPGTVGEAESSCERVGRTVAEGDSTW